MILVGYYDYLNSQSREDYYSIEDGEKSECIYTSIRKYSEGRNYMVFRRAFTKSLMASPNSCFVTPMIGHLPAPDIIRHSQYVGSKTLEIVTTHDTRTERHIRTNVWDIDWYETTYRLYLAETLKGDSIRPIRIESANANYTIIDYHESLFLNHNQDENTVNRLFDAQHESTAKCSAVSSRHHWKSGL
jgi:hypothetical protein